MNKVTSRQNQEKCWFPLVLSDPIFELTLISDFFLMLSQNKYLLSLYDPIFGKQNHII